MNAPSRPPSRSVPIWLPLAAFAAVSSSASMASANSLYVAPTGTGRDCSCDSPCSLDTGAMLAQAGDTVFLLDGTYTTPVSPANSGTSSAWITFQAAPGALPIVDGSSQPAGSTGLGSSTQVYLRFVGIVAQNWSSAFANGWTGMGTTNSNGHFQYINCIADGNTRNGFVFNSAQGVLVQQCIVAHNGSSATASWSSGVQLFEVQGTAADNIVQQNVSFENADMQNHTDGSGFIVDQMCTGAAFINNIAFRNGGSCIRLTKSSNTHIINNTCYHDGLDPQDTAPTNPGEIYFTDDASRMGLVFENNLAIASGSTADATGFVNPPTGGGSNDFSMGAGSTPFFADPAGTNPNFELTAAGSTSIVDKGTASNAPSTDIGFDPKCIKAGSPGGGVSWWQNSIDYAYIKSIGGVAACFNPGKRPAGNAPDIGAYEMNAVIANPRSANQATVACTPGTGGTGLTGEGGAGGADAEAVQAVDAGSPSVDAGAPASSGGSSGGSGPAGGTSGGSGGSSGGPTGGSGGAMAAASSSSGAPVTGGGSSGNAASGGGASTAAAPSGQSRGGCAMTPRSSGDVWVGLILVPFAAARRRGRRLPWSERRRHERGDY